MQFLYEGETLTEPEFKLEVQRMSNKVDRTKREELTLLIVSDATLTQIATFIGMEFVPVITSQISTKEYA